MGIAQSKGLLNFDDKITKHWPEYGKHGKENQTIADLMRHSVGLFSISKEIDLNWLTSDNIKKNMMGEVLENEKPVWLT